MAVKSRTIKSGPKQFTFAVLLARASKGSNDRSEGMVTLDVQLDEMRAWCKVRGLEVLREFREDGRSGYKPGTRRPDYEDAVALAKEMGAVLVTYYLDRLTRQGVLATLRVITELDQAGAGYASAKEDFTTTGPMGDVLVAFAAALAQMESEKKSERASDTHFAKAMNGEHMGGPRPYGYQWDYVPDANGKDKRVRGTMHVVEAEASWLRDAAAMILAGVSQRAVIDALNIMGAPTAQGGEWRHQTLRKALTSPTSVGCREIDGHGLVEGKWPAILDRATFDALRANYEGRKNPDHSTTRQWMLSGLMTCARCGGVVRSKWHSKGKRYACVDCGVSVNAGLADEHVTRMLLSEVTPASWNRLRTATKANVTADISEQVDALREALVDQMITPDQFRESMAKLAALARPTEPAPDLPPFEDLLTEFPLASPADRALVVACVYPSIVLLPGNDPVSERVVLKEVAPNH